MRENTEPWTRRHILGGVAAGTVALTGCLGDDDTSETSLTGETHTPVRGDPDAAVTLEVYEDYGCPGCRSYVLDTSAPLVEEYVTTEQIRYEHRDLPIPVEDPESWEAANAARAALETGDIDGFWEYKRRLYEEQGRLASDTPALYGELAEELGLDGDDVQGAAVDQIYDDAVTGDREQAEDLEVPGTPGFVLDGDVLGSGPNAVDTVMTAIDDALNE